MGTIQDKQAEANTQQMWCVQMTLEASRAKSNDGVRLALLFQAQGLVTSPRSTLDPFGDKALYQVAPDDL